MGLTPVGFPTWEVCLSLMVDREGNVLRYLDIKNVIFNPDRGNCGQSWPPGLKDSGISSS